MRIVKRLLAGLAGVLALALAVGLLMPQHAGLERSVHIEAPPANVFAVLAGFRNFSKWSPWAELDPGMQVGFEGPVVGVGARYQWSGNSKVGSGSQQIVAVKPNSEVDLKLRFGNSPAPSDAAFHIEPEGQGSRVTWRFRADLGSNPFSRLMAPLMRHFVGQDYERGLAKMKTYIESLPKVDLTGLEATLSVLPPVTYVYAKGTTTTDAVEISRAIALAFAQVRAGLQKQNVAPAGAPLAITRRWDDAAKVYEFEAGIPVAADVSAAPEGLLIGKTYSGLAITVEFRGPYSGIKHAYEQIDALQTAYGLQPNGDVWEQYPNDPATTAPEALVTLIEVPVK